MLIAILVAVLMFLVVGICWVRSLLAHEYLRECYQMITDIARVLDEDKVNRVQMDNIMRAYGATVERAREATEKDVR